MARKRHTPEQIAAALRQSEAGAPEIRELRQLRDENSGLKRLVADLTLDKTMLQDVISKKW